MARAPKKTVDPAAEAKPAAKAPARRTAPKPAPVIIRNLRSVPVHLRLEGIGDKPYRIQLAPRGNQGDTATVPVACQGDTPFTHGVGVLFEVITQTEKNKLEVAYPATGYQTRTATEVIRPEDTTLATMPEWDGKGQAPYSEVKRDSRNRQIPETQGRTGDHVNMNVHNFPGSDAGLHSQLAAGGDAAEAAALAAKGVLPPGAFPQRVVVEKARG